MKLRRAGTITKVIVLVLAIYGIVNLVSIWRRIETAQDEQNAIVEQITELEAANADREFELEHYDDPRVIEGIARAELGLVMPGEMVLVDESP